MSYMVEEIETSFEATVNPKPDWKFRGTIISANSTAIYKDASIECKRIQVDKALYDGSIKFKVKYGFPGLEKYIIERDLNLNLPYDHKTGNFTVAGMSDRVS